MKNTIFDFKRFSVQEYNELLHEFWLDSHNIDTSIFGTNVICTERSKQQVLTIIFDNNSWLKVDKCGWWFKYFDDSTQDVITSGFYNKERFAESCGFDDIGFVYRPAKGITYKSFTIKECDVTRKGNNKMNVIVPRAFSYRLDKFKKYTEHHLSTHSGLSFYEKINNNGKVLRTSVRVQGLDRVTYSMHISCEAKNKIKVSMHKNFERIEYVQYFDFKDASIDFVYNKYVTFNFDLIADPIAFEVMEGIRVFLKKNIEDTYDILRKENKHSAFIKKVLNTIEVMEDDRTQIQEWS